MFLFCYGNKLTYLQSILAGYLEEDNMSNKQVSLCHQEMSPIFGWSFDWRVLLVSPPSFHCVTHGDFDGNCPCNRPAIAAASSRHNGYRSSDCLPVMAASLLRLSGTR